MVPSASNPNKVGSCEVTFGRLFRMKEKSNERTQLTTTASASASASAFDPCSSSPTSQDSRFIPFITSGTAEKNQLSAHCMWPSGLLRQYPHHLRIGKTLQRMNKPLLHTFILKPLVLTISCRAINADLLSCSVKRLLEYRYSTLE